MKLAVFICAVISLCLVGCQEGDDGHTHGEDAFACPNPDEYEDGLTRSSEDGSVQVSLLGVNMEPHHPGVYEWTAMLMDAAGNPSADAPLAVCLWMPEHGHGSPVETIVARGEDEGVFDVTTDLFMAGQWDVKYRTAVDSDPCEGDKAEDTLASDTMFRICIMEDEEEHEH